MNYKFIKNNFKFYLAIKFIEMSKKVKSDNQSLQIPKLILLTAKLLQSISLNLVTRFAAKLFTTPIKHKIPKRELPMDNNSIQQLVKVPAINKEIMMYHYGKSENKILLVHGWSGRGTQLIKIADNLLELGYSTISFDAPAHGKSNGHFTIMTEFIASILELEKQYGPFDYAIGHSLGGMSILNALKQNLKVKKAVIIGSGDIIQDIVIDFVKKLQLKPIIADKLQKHFETKFGEPMNNYSAFVAAKNIEIPILIIHDADDVEVSVKAAHHIHEHLKNSKIIITKELGHRKILGNQKVIDEINEFIKC
jgi:pimeloyl-ACP methyl ester carboxylesterase